MNPFTRLLLSVAALYLRRAPTPVGRWRLIDRFLPPLREQGSLLGERLVRTRYGFYYNADLGDWLGQYVYLTGVYEPPTARVIAALLKAGDTFVDVGANSGFFTLLGATQVGRTGRVFSFEPVPSMRNRLMENIRLNKISNVLVHDMAVSNSFGALPLFEGPEGHKGISSLRQIDDSPATIEVKTIPLDSFDGALAGLTLIKIDVEGAEQLVLDGMTTILSHYHPYIVIEITDGYLKAFGHSATRLAHFLVRNGYEMYAIRPEGLVPMQADKAADEDQFNALFAFAPIPQELLGTERERDA